MMHASPHHSIDTASAMSRQVILPRLELGRHIRNFMVSGFDSMEVHLPALIDVQLVIYLQGQCLLHDGDAFAVRSPTAFVAGPSLLPRRFRVEPGSRFIAATFRPSGFFSCFGIPVNTLNDLQVPLDSLVGDNAATALTERLSQSKTSRAQVGILEAFLMQQLVPGKDEEAFLPALPLERALLPASELASAFDISTRQLERRFLIRYGVSLRDYRRFARFSTALAGLMQGGIRHGALAGIALDAEYADQAHFANDFRQFVGASPGQFIKAQQQSDSPYRLWQFNADELRTYLDD